MCWSKNVQEERDAPDQILLGAMDLCYCVLVGDKPELEQKPQGLVGTVQ